MTNASNQPKKYPLVSGFLVLLLTLAAPLAAWGASSISQFGITWTFDGDYPTGQFANGDYWVVGPVTVTSISPRSTYAGGGTINGSMINPQVNGPQGYDSRIKNNPYSDSLNVGSQLPLRLGAGTSLLSSQSYPQWASGDNPQLQTIAILTVLGAPAPAGSFRPPPVGGDKSLRWNANQLDYSRLRSLAPMANTPDLDYVTGQFERPWIEQNTTWVSRYLHPGDNQPSYGREIAHTLATGLLSLQLNYRNDQKQTLLIRLVQYGLDVYGSARLGGNWIAGGGHDQGRKMPMLLAGVVLGDPNIVALADGQNLLFQEDQQTFHVGWPDIGRLLYSLDGRLRLPYLPSMLGLAEWGEKHADAPAYDGSNWDVPYRTVSGSSTIGHVLCAHLMGLEQAWDWPATFDYYDRYWSIEGPNAGGGANSIQLFVAGLWQAYRQSSPGTAYTPPPPSSGPGSGSVSTGGSTGSVTPPTNPGTSGSNPVWQNITGPSSTGTGTLSFDVTASSNGGDSLVGVSNGGAGNPTDLAAAVRFGPTGTIDAYDGNSFQAANRVTYWAGVTYHVVMTIDVPNGVYSVTVAGPGGWPVTIANGWRFRAEQASVPALDNLAWEYGSDHLAVSNPAIQ